MGGTWRKAQAMDRQATLDYLEDNERRRRARRDQIRAAVGRRITDQEVERIVALSTGLEALYDVGRQDEVICRFLRRHADQDINRALDRAEWAWVADR